MTGETQTLMRATPFGVKPILAPAGRQFDATAVIAWAKLVDLSRSKKEDFSTVREKQIWSSRVHTLAGVLSNALGMPPTYWTRFAAEIAGQEDRS